MPSKMVTDRQALGAQVAAAIDSHAGEAEAAFALQVRSVLGGGEPQVGELQVTVRQMLDRHLALLVEADEAHVAAMGDLAEPRRLRGEATTTLYTALVGVRRIAEGLYGDRTEELLRLGGPVSQNPVVLLRQAQRVVARLTDAEVPRPERRVTSAFDEAEWVEQLAAPVAELDEALSRLRSALRRTESTLKAKNEALAAYDLAFGRVSRFMEALFDLAGLPSFASRLRPPVGRRAGAGGGTVVEFPTAVPPEEPVAEPEEPLASGDPTAPGEADEGESPPEEAPPLTAVG